MHKKILLIDDEKDLIEALKARLEAKDHTIMVAYDGEEGLHVLEKEKPDLIIVDIMMPKMDGYTFVKELKAMRLDPAIPIIVLTARGQMQDLFAMEEIVVTYLQKPYEANDLLKLVENALEKVI